MATTPTLFASSFIVSSFTQAASGQACDLAVRSVGCAQDAESCRKSSDAQQQSSMGIGWVNQPFWPRESFSAGSLIDRGLNLVHLPRTAPVDGQDNNANKKPIFKRFDMFGEAEAHEPEDAFIDYLRQLEAGELILIAVDMTEASGQTALTEAHRLGIEAVTGSKLIQNLGRRSAWCFIGRTGGNVSAPIVHVEQINNQDGVSGSSTDLGATCRWNPCVPTARPTVAPTPVPTPAPEPTPVPTRPVSTPVPTHVVSARPTRTISAVISDEPADSSDSITDQVETGPHQLMQGQQDTCFVGRLSCQVFIAVAVMASAVFVLLLAVIVWRVCRPGAFCPCGDSPVKDKGPVMEIRAGAVVRPEELPESTRVAVEDRGYGGWPIAGEAVEDDEGNAWEDVGEPEEQEPARSEDQVASPSIGRNPLAGIGQQASTDQSTMDRSTNSFPARLPPIEGRPSHPTQEPVAPITVDW